MFGAAGMRAVAKRLRTDSKNSIIDNGSVRCAFFDRLKLVNRVICLSVEKYFQKFIGVKSFLIRPIDAKGVCFNKPFHLLADFF